MSFYEFRKRIMEEKAKRESWYENDKLKKRIAELEEKVKHLTQVIYNVSKVSFEEGACCPYVDFHEHAIIFAKKIHSHHVKEQEVSDGNS